MENDEIARPSQRRAGQGRPLAARRPLTRREVSADGRTAVHNVFGGGYDYRTTVSVWFRGAFTLHPHPEATTGAPPLFQLHALSACLLCGAWPFTRLFHVWSALVGHLVRPYLVHRRRAATPAPAVRGVPAAESRSWRAA